MADEENFDIKQFTIHEILQVTEEHYQKNFKPILDLSSTIFATLLGIPYVPGRVNNQIRNAMNHLGTACECLNKPEIDKQEIDTAITNAIWHINIARRFLLSRCAEMLRDNINESLFYLKQRDIAVNSTIETKFNDIDGKIENVLGGVEKHRVKDRTDSISNDLLDIVNEYIEIYKDIKSTYRIPKPRTVRRRNLLPKIGQVANNNWIANIGSALLLAALAGIIGYFLHRP